MRVYKDASGRDAIAMVARARHGASQQAQRAAADARASGQLPARVSSPPSALIRVQDQCMTSEIFGSLKCDCKQQLDHAMHQVQARAGQLWSLLCEGRAGSAARHVSVSAKTYNSGSSVDAVDDAMPAPSHDGTDSDSSIPATRSSGSVSSLATPGTQPVDGDSEVDSNGHVEALPRRTTASACGSDKISVADVDGAVVASRADVSGDTIAGAVVYLMQEGRGIGLAAKVAAYALQEDTEEEDDTEWRAGGTGCGERGHQGAGDAVVTAAAPGTHVSGPTSSTCNQCTPGGAAALPGRRRRGRGLDTVDANRALGLPDDVREYGAVVDVLADLGLLLPSFPQSNNDTAPEVVAKVPLTSQVLAAAADGPVGAQLGIPIAPDGPGLFLLTNNPRKLAVLRGLGVPLAGRVPCHVLPTSPLAANYLRAKAQRMGHDIPAHVYTFAGGAGRSE
jgi:GTP cyclohydrolase II